MNHKIIVTVSDKSSKTAQGKLLEDVGAKILLALQFKVTKEIRLVGMEVDLLAKREYTGEEIYVECKAHRGNLSADVLTKIIGNVAVKGVSAGWLITTGPLGKDAKGIMDEWERKEASERAKLVIFTYDRIIKLLIDNKMIVSDISLQLPKLKSYRDESILMISDIGMFWLKFETSDGSTIAEGVTCFSAETGNQITTKKVLSRIKELEPEYQNLSWDSELLDNKLIKDEMNSVIEVSSGDEWADYRPSRPEDFVGRKLLVDEVVHYFSKVKTQLSSTRLFSITAPSGWGKSSFLLKLSDEIKSKYNNKYFIYSIDLRAAVSSRYAEFGIMDCFNKAIEKGFINAPKTDLTYTSASVPFEHESFQCIFEQLRNEEKVIVICFDQFEETFSKKELVNLFDNIKKISINVDSLKENLVLGFAWKTDVVFPGDHSAYHMWHRMNDRRSNFELTVFSQKEIKQAIRLFSKQIGEQINKILQEYLIDQCQGYPWLLKKFCIHVYKLIRNGTNQTEIIGQNMDIENLFHKDLSELSHMEDACVKKIADDTPADYYIIHGIFGESVLQELINKRLVIRKANKLILYWDIFRDYVVDGKVPKILYYYVPQVSFDRYLQVIEFMDKEKNTTYSELAIAMKITESSSMNIVKDLIMYGNLTKVDEKIEFVNSGGGEAIERIYSFWENHIVVKIIRDRIELNPIFYRDDLKELFKDVHAFSHLTEKTKETYFNKIITWLLNMNIIELDSNVISLVDEKNKITFGSIDALKYNIIRRKSIFLGQATYKKVTELVNVLKVRDLTVSELKVFRNEISILNSLDLTKRNSNKIELNMKNIDTESVLKEAVRNTYTIQVIKKHVEKTKSKLTPIIVGKILKDKLYKKSWKDASIVRNGGGVLRWYNLVYTKK